jgi:hypothetical protein
MTGLRTNPARFKQEGFSAKKLGHWGWGPLKRSQEDYAHQSDKGVGKKAVFHFGIHIELQLDDDLGEQRGMENSSSIPLSTILKLI